MKNCCRLVVWISLASCQSNSEVGSNKLQSADASRTWAQCFDGIDNDADTYIDYPWDPGCATFSDNDESDPAILPACKNSQDDDGDGIFDFPEEPGCTSASDDDEMDPRPTPQCADGIDNDMNLDTDYPDDSGCYAAGDDSESLVTN